MNRQAKVVLIFLSVVTMIADAQSPTRPSTQTVVPQVRPALRPDQLPVPQPQQDAASRERTEADKARREAQAKEEQRLKQEIQARGYWVDPSTGLMWAAKDNGKDVKWGQAMKYCRDLRLAAYSDWRLATIDELQGIYDGSGSSSSPSPMGGEYVLAGRPRGGLYLTGNNHWSSDKVKDDRGHSTGYAWLFNFPHGKRDKDDSGYYASKRALCVRHPKQ